MIYRYGLSMVETNFTFPPPACHVRGEKSLASTSLSDKSAES